MKPAYSGREYSTGMSTSATSAVYIQVVEDVINKVREEFVSDSGPGENVLRDLQSLWEVKMMQAGAVLPQNERPVVPRPSPAAGVTPVHDLNVPYEGNEEYETPTAEMLFPPTPLQTPIQTPMPGTADSSMYNIPTGLSDYPTPNPTPNSNEMNGTPNMDIKPAAGRSNSYMPPPSPWMNQRPSPGVDVNVAYVDQREEAGRIPSQQGMQDLLTGKRKRDDIPQQYPGGGYIPQQDGAGDATPEFFELEIIQSNSFGRNVNIISTRGKGTSGLQKASSSKIPQLDGPIPDPYDDILSTPNIYPYQVVNEDYNVVNTPAPDMQAGTPAPLAMNDIGNDDDDEPPLNENDDDDLDDIDEGEELSTTHLVLAQFDKVTRTKSRWKCTLKDGIMRINNKDILFNKASGEFDF